MRSLIAVATASVVLTTMASPASSAPDFARIGQGASDIARNCVAKGKSPEYIIYACTETIGLTPWHDAAWPYFARALAYLRLDQSKSALDDLDVAAKLGTEGDANLHGIYFDRCYVRLRLGNDLQGALGDCNKALSLRAGDVDTLALRAVVEYRVGSFSAAITDCDSILQKEPNLAPSLYIRGLAELKTGDIAKSKADMAANGPQPSIAAWLSSLGVTQ